MGLKPMGPCARRLQKVQKSQVFFFLDNTKEWYVAFFSSFFILSGYNLMTRPRRDEGRRGATIARGRPALPLRRQEDNILRSTLKLEPGPSQHFEFVLVS